MKPLHLLHFLLALCCGLLPWPAWGQAGFIKFAGVDGEARDLMHKDWIELVAFRQSFQNPAGAKVVAEHLTFSKRVDKASPKLAQACALGKIFPVVEIHLVREGLVYFTYELRNVRISAYSVGNTPGDLPMEELSLRFEELRVTYTEYDADGRSRAMLWYTYNASKGPAE